MKLNRLLLLLILLLGAVTLFAAEILDSELFLDVLLYKGTQIKVSNPATIIATEGKSPIGKSITGDFTIQLSGSESTRFYGILNRIDTIDLINKPLLPQLEFDNDDLNIRSGFVWESGKLKIIKEKLVFEDKSFTDFESASEYCISAGIPIKNITPIPMNNPQIRIVPSKGQSHYFELPLHLISDQDLKFGTDQLGYSGEFIIKSSADGLILCQNISLEDYIAGVIQNEIGSGAPIEALKTQAVAARSHAISLLLYNRHKQDGYDLCNTTHCQVYKGKHLLNQSVLDAVYSTEGEILTYDQRIASTTYHSSSGGKTDSSVNIWRGSVYPYLNGVVVYTEAENYDLTKEAEARLWIDYQLKTTGLTSWERSSLSWERSISSSQVAKNLNLSSIDSIEVVRRGFSGRILSLRINGSFLLEGEYKIRQALGGLPSSFFYIHGIYSTTATGNPLHKISATIRVKGKGSGHGVGMCQVGTLQLARSGMDYRSILSFFYPGTTLEKDWMD